MSRNGPRRIRSGIPVVRFASIRIRPKEHPVIPAGCDSIVLPTGRDDEDAPEWNHPAEGSAGRFAFCKRYDGCGGGVDRPCSCRRRVRTWSTCAISRRTLERGLIRSNRS